MKKFAICLSLAIMTLSMPYNEASDTNQQHIKTRAKAAPGVKTKDNDQSDYKVDKATPAKAMAPKEPQPTLNDEQRAFAIAELRAKHLGLPIAGFNVATIKGSFDESHFGAKHGASDMLAPRNTPILAIEDGIIAKLFFSKDGGITIYQADPTGKYVYYYAHLEKYADNLKDGDKIKKGQVIGYVGTSGNAPANTPHLHMAIGVGDALKKWWNVADLDPYKVFK